LGDVIFSFKIHSSKICINKKMYKIAKYYFYERFIHDDSSIDNFSLNKNYSEETSDTQNIYTEGGHP
jgi:hypothetical protein